MMVNKTDAEDERDEVSEPFVAASIDKIVPMVEQGGVLHRSEEKAQKARSELGNHYQKIEKDYHGHRGAVKLIRALVSGTTDAAHDFMRTFLPLARRFDLIPGEDLVDMMEQHAPPAEGEDPGTRVSDTAVGEKSSVVPHPERENAIDRAKRRMKDGDKPPAPAGEEGSGDLARAGEEVAEEIERQREEDARKFDVPADIPDETPAA